MADDAREPDETARMEPVGDETAPMAPAGDETAPMEQVGDRTAPLTQAGDETAPLSRVGDETAPLAPVGDATAPLSRAGDETAPIPPVAGDTARLGRTADQTTPMPAVAGAEAARWSGRAGVQPPRAGALPVGEPEWEQVERAPARTWWLPILIGVVALILIGLILLGVWLALRGNQAPLVAPSPTATATASQAPSPPPAPSPSPPPSPSAAPDVTAVPPLRGRSLAEAEQALTAANLTYTVQTQVDPTVSPGTVIGTQPGAGTEVPVGSQVTIIVAAAPPSSAPPESPPST